MVPAGGAISGAGDAGHRPRSALLIGDKVSLFQLEAFGFLRGDGFVHDYLTVDPLDYKEPSPLNFEDCLFEIEFKLNYFAQQRLQDFVSHNNLHSEQDFTLLKGDKARIAKQLQAEAALEVSQNKEDARFYRGRPVEYGMAFQLRHVNTNKFLSAIFGANLTDVQGAADVELTNGSMGSYFKLQSIRGMKSSSELCCERELVQVVPERLPTIALAARREDVITLDGNNRPVRTPLRVVCSKEGSTWMVSRYQAIADVTEHQKGAGVKAADAELVLGAPEDSGKPVALCTGQVVRLLHKETDVFLAADPGKSQTGDTIKKRSLLVSEPACGYGSAGWAPNARENPGTSYSLWIIENLDPTVASPLQYGTQFRIRNLATGGYLLSHWFAHSKPALAMQPHAHASRSPASLLNTSWAGGLDNTRSFIGGALMEEDMGSHVAFCGQEVQLLASTRSILSFQTSETANEGVKTDDEVAVQSQNILYLRFEHLQPRTASSRFNRQQAADAHRQQPSASIFAGGGVSASVLEPGKRAGDAKDSTSDTESIFSEDTGVAPHGKARAGAAPAAGSASAGGAGSGLLGSGLLDFSTSLGGVFGQGAEGGQARPGSVLSQMQGEDALGQGPWSSRGEGFDPEKGWLHIDDPDRGIQKPKPGICPVFHEFNGWMVYPAELSEVRDVQYVSSICNKVHSFMAASRRQGSIKEQDSAEIARLFLRLQRFLSFKAGDRATWHADDPTSQDHVTRRQGIMYDMGLVDDLVSLSSHLEQFSTHLSHRHIASDPDQGHLRYLCASSYRLLTLLARRNHIIGMHMSDCILQLIEPLDCLAAAHKGGGGSEDTQAHYLQDLVQLVGEIYHDSPAALGNLDATHFRHFVSLFRGSTSAAWHAALLQLVGMMCVYRARDSDDGSEDAAAMASLLQSAQMGGTSTSRRSGDYLGVPNNQQHLVALLDSMDVFSMFPQTKLNEANSNEMLVAFKRGGAALEWQPVEEALLRPQDQLLFENFIVFLKNSMHGRSKVTDEAMATIDRLHLMDFDRALHILLSQTCPARTRAIAAAFICNGFVDNNPQQDCCAVLRFQDWNALKAPLANSGDHSRANSKQFAVLLAFCLMYLETNDVQGADFHSDSLLEETLKLNYFLVRYGFWSQTIKTVMGFADAAANDQETPDASKKCFGYLMQRVVALYESAPRVATLEEWAEASLMVELLIQPLWLLLDISSDHDVTSPEARARFKAKARSSDARGSSGGIRFCSVVDNTEVEHMDVYIGSKKWACRTCDLIANVRLNKRVRTALEVFESDLHNGKKLGDSAVIEQEATAHKVRRSDFEKIFQVLDLDVDRAAPICLQLLVNNAMQLDSDASYAVLQLLLRLFGQRHEVMRTLGQILLITEQEVLYIYKSTSAICQQMSRLNVRLAACEHKLIEAMHLYDKMQLEREAQHLAQGLDGGDAGPGVAMARGSWGAGAQATATGLLGSFGAGLGQLGNTLAGGLDLGGVSSPLASPKGHGKAPAQVQINTLMDGKGGIFDNLLGAPSDLFDQLNTYTSSKTHRTPRGSVSSAALRPTSIQEHRQVINMRRLASSGGTRGAEAGGNTPGSVKKKKSMRGDLMKDVEKEAEQRLVNASHQGRSLAFDSSVVEELKTVVAELVAKIEHLLSIASSRQVPIPKIQHMFRTLNVHLIVVECIAQLMSSESPRMPQNNSLSLLLYNSFCFLALFASGLPENQEIVFRYLERYIEPQLSNDNVVFAAAAEAFIGTFKNNRVISSRFNDKMCTAIIGCIKSGGTNGRRACYLKCLAAVCCPRGIPIKRNQLRVLTHLDAQDSTGQEDFLPTYVGGDGLKTLRRLMEDTKSQFAANIRTPRRNSRGGVAAAGGGHPATVANGTVNSVASEEGRAAAALQEDAIPFTPRRQLALDRQACPVVFFEETLLLLAECSMGSASEVEKACQKFIPIRHVAALVTEPWCVPAVKIAALTFLREAHFDVADPAARQGACVDRSTWKILKYLRETLVKVVARVPETFCDISLYGPLPKLVEEALVVQALKLVTVFLHKCYRAKLVSRDDGEELSMLVDILIRMMSEGGLSPPISRAPVGALTEFDKRDIASGSTVKQYLKTLLRSSFMDILEQDKLETKDSASYRDPRSELPNFLRDLHNRLDTLSESRALCVTFESSPGAVQVITRNLYKSRESNRQEYVAVLDYLWQSLTRSRPLDDVMRIMRIDLLIEAVVKLVAQGSDSCVEAALKLGCSLLQHAHAPIQDKFLEEMRQPHAHPMLQHLLQRIEMAREEMRELRIIVTQLVSDLDPSALEAKRCLEDIMREGSMAGM